MENIVFPHAVKEGLTIILNDEAEQPITPLKEHLQSSMPHNFAKQAIWILKSCAEHRFFLIEHEQMGLAPSEAEIGDIVCIILGASVPFDLRPEGNAFKLIGGCYVQGVVKGEALFRLGRAYIRLLQLKTMRAGNTCREVRGGMR